ncbi:DSS1/SEM1-like protein [Artemisia annua]|uniref:26S proteasome complex subunit SEM1 n=1 Tax=Artemisia annua TaxID=35608 RepID=A0A2U1MV08_ARTAN|nr:DSS1/SEM1-like protein [Artemisia annua]
MKLNSLTQRLLMPVIWFLFLDTGIIILTFFRDEVIRFLRISFMKLNSLTQRLLMPVIWFLFLDTGIIILKMHIQSSTDTVRPGVVVAGNYLNHILWLIIMMLKLAEWDVKEEGKEVAQQWEDDWDDDDVNDDFSLQLRRELESNTDKK